MSVTITIKQIVQIAKFAGVHVDETKSVGFGDDADYLDQEFTISEKIKLDLEDGQVYEGMTVHITEYPEEGFLALE